MYAAEWLLLVNSTYSSPVVGQPSAAADGRGEEGRGVLRALLQIIFWDFECRRHRYIHKYLLHRDIVL